MKVLICFVMFFSSCVSVPEIVQPEYEKAKVIERIGDVGERPDWAVGTKSIFSEGGDISYVSMVTMKGNTRPDACLQVSANKGRSQILREIYDQITTSGEQLEETGESDPFITTTTAFIAQGNLRGVKHTESYWEKREESDQDGMRVLKIFCAAKVSIKRSELQRQMKAAIKKEHNVKDKIVEKLLSKQLDFLDKADEGEKEQEVVENE